MPVQIDEVTSTTQFDGTSGKGLFDASGASSGDQIYIRNFLLHFAGTAPVITVTFQDPDNASNTVTIFSATANDYAVLSGIWIPTNSSGTPWDLKVATTGKDNTGFMTIDWELKSTGE